MVICPVALAVGCKKCPIFTVCPVKGVIGDYKKPESEDTKPAAAAGKPPVAAGKPASSAPNRSRSKKKKR